MERKLGRIKEFFYKNRAVALVVLVGVLLMLLPTGKTEAQQPQRQETVSEPRENLETRLEQILSQVSGAAIPMAAVQSAPRAPTMAVSANCSRVKAICSSMVGHASFSTVRAGVEPRCRTLASGCGADMAQSPFGGSLYGAGDQALPAAGRARAKNPRRMPIPGSGRPGY